MDTFVLCEQNRPIALIDTCVACKSTIVINIEQKSPYIEGTKAFYCKICKAYRPLSYQCFPIDNSVYLSLKNTIKSDAKEEYKEHMTRAEMYLKSCQIPDIDFVTFAEYYYSEGGFAYSIWSDKQKFYIMNEDPNNDKPNEEYWKDSDLEMLRQKILGSKSFLNYNDLMWYFVCLLKRQSDEQREFDFLESLSLRLKQKNWAGSIRNYYRFVLAENPIYDEWDTDEITIDSP